VNGDRSNRLISNICISVPVIYGLNYEKAMAKNESIDIVNISVVIK